MRSATPAAIEYAKAWVCPTCAASVAHGQPLESTTRLRPFGFYQTIGMNIKYLKDADKKQLVVLSIIDFGTSWHVAVILKNRKPKHVAKMFFKEWVSHYGVPNEVVVDQGREFMSYLNDLFEQHGIDSRAVGAQAPWQHGVTERHGGLRYYVEKDSIRF